MLKNEGQRVGEDVFEVGGDLAPRPGWRSPADLAVRPGWAEDGRSSDRWYRVRTSGGEAWLRAVRLAATAPPTVAHCGQ